MGETQNVQSNVLADLRSLNLATLRFLLSALARRVVSYSVAHLLTFFACRPNLQLSSQVDVGIHRRGSSPKRVSTMACLRSADAPPSMVVDREWKRWRDTTDSSLLDLKGVDVCVKFCAGGLGST